MTGNEINERIVGVVECGPGMPMGHLIANDLDGVTCTACLCFRAASLRASMRALDAELELVKSQLDILAADESMFFVDYPDLRHLNRKK